MQTTIKKLEILPFNWACCSNRTQGSSFNITLGQGDTCFFAWPRLVLAPPHDFGTTSQELQTKDIQTYKSNNGRRKLKQHIYRTSPLCMKRGSRPPPIACLPISSGVSKGPTSLATCHMDNVSQTWQVVVRLHSPCQCMRQRTRTLMASEVTQLGPIASFGQEP